MFQVAVGATGKSAIWFCERHATSTPEDRLVGYTAPVMEDFAEPNHDDAQTQGQKRVLYSNSLAKMMSMSVRGGFQDASCIAYDEALGVLCVGTNRGGIHVLRYTTTPPADGHAENH